MAIIFGNAIERLQSAAAIDGTSTGSTVVYNAPASRDAVVLAVVVRCESATAISAPATAQLETSPAAEDIFSSEAMTGLVAADDTYEFTGIAGGSVVSGGDSLSINITSAATGTAQSLGVDVIGYLV